MPPYWLCGITRQIVRWRMTANPDTPIAFILRLIILIITYVLWIPVNRAASLCGMVIVSKCLVFVVVRLSFHLVSSKHAYILVKVFVDGKANGNLQGARGRDGV